MHLEKATGQVPMPEGTLQLTMVKHLADSFQGDWMQEPVPLSPELNKSKLLFCEDMRTIVKGTRLACVRPWSCSISLVLCSAAKAMQHREVTFVFCRILCQHRRLPLDKRILISASGSYTRICFLVHVACKSQKVLCDSIYFSSYNFAEEQ